MEKKNKYQELIANRPANAALSYPFVEKIIREVVSRHYPEISVISRISHETYKRRVGKLNSAFIYGYTVAGITRTGAAIQKLIVYSAHTDGTRKIAFNNMKMLIDAGFNEGPYQITRPLEYRDDLHAMMYEGIFGTKLFDFFKQHTAVYDLQSLVAHIACWIAKFHALRLAPGLTAALPTFNWHDVNQPLSSALPNIREHDAHQGEKFQAFLTAFEKLESSLASSFKPSLVYGDLHPENAVFDSLTTDHLTMIDFTDVSIGDPVRDLGTFTQQLWFMGKDFYARQDTRQLITIFLEAYFNKPVSSITETEWQRINAYQAWNALRSFIYFFYQPETQQSSYGLLEDAWLYLSNAINKHHDFSINT